MLRVHIQKSIQLCAAHARDAGHLIVPSKKGLSLHTDGAHASLIRRLRLPITITDNRICHLRPSN